MRDPGFISGTFLFVDSGRASSKVLCLREGRSRVCGLLSSKGLLVFASIISSSLANLLVLPRWNRCLFHR